MSNKQLILLVLMSILCFSLFGTVIAQDVFVIEPSKEVTRSVESIPGCVSICGNLTVTNGFVDFYVTSPSGTILFCYNKTAFTDFFVTTTENGTYTFHVVNSWSNNTVTATLYYGRNFEVMLQENMVMSFDVLTQTSFVSIERPIFPWIEIAKLIGTTIIAPIIVRLLSDYIHDKYQKWKDGKPKTPVVFKISKAK